MRRAVASLACVGLVASVPESSPSFALDVLPVLQKQGCASAYCHGSATGRGGFKLSLFGSDARADWAAITQDLGGRRLDRRDPAQSLLLQKPTRAIKHGGGKRLATDDAGYGLIARWIASGAGFDAGTAMTALELRPGEGGYRAIATISGTPRDVTTLALWSSSDEAILMVDGAGRIERKQPGPALVTARLAGHEAHTADTLPYGPGPLLGLRAAPRAPEPVLARRLYLDLAGRLPTRAEIEDFDLGRAAPGLIASPRFARVFAGHLAAWFEIPPEDAQSLVRLPLAELVARLLELRSWLPRKEDPRDRAELYARSLLGLRIGCARCHDHPLDRWRQREHLAFSACFVSPRPAPGGGTRPGQFFDPESGAVITPRPLPLAGAAETGSLLDLALTAGGEPMRRNFANRVLALLLGRAPVEPIDDHRPTNPARNPELLARITAAATSIQDLVTAIVTSPEYSLASEPEPALDHGAARVQAFLRREAREMSPSLLVAALGSALGQELRLALPSEPLARELALREEAWLPAAIARSDLGGLDLADLFWRVLGRAPSAAERERLAGEAMGDVAFALLCSREFRSIR